MPNPPPLTANLFGLQLNAVCFQDAVEILCQQVPLRPAKVVVTPNVDHVISLADNTALRDIYNSADFKFADGMPVVWASRLLGQPLPERVTGADLFVALCQQAQERHWHVAVLGGMPGDESMLLTRFAEVYPGLQVTIKSPPMGFDYQSGQGSDAANWVNAVQPDVVFVCLGFPRQSLWSLKNRADLDTGLVLCVGAAMEFALGLKSRAPLWMQSNGMEWLWRLASEPGKLWRRYLVRGPRFLTLVWREWRGQQ
jgi:N-acetylglucosaminyldiphosphoundecaprenol N-acetyl-beta-D-mannosaminyltransferase